MAARHHGIDEAGYGPTLGPLVVAMVSSDTPPTELDQAWRAHGCAVTDSKQLHRPGSIGPLEAVALGILTWATGFTPATAAEVFAICGEGPDQLNATPWTTGATALKLPIARDPRPLPELGAGGGIRGAILHPWHLNGARDQGINRSAAQWQAIASILPTAPSHGQQSIMCDRLGGRTHYHELLAALRPAATIREVMHNSKHIHYQISAGHGQEDVHFLVGGETHNCLIAAASCVAKYARELHMLLLNQWWCGQLRWLKPTAGYPQDAKRWLHQIGAGHRNAWGYQLERGWHDPELAHQQ